MWFIFPALEKMYHLSALPQSDQLIVTSIAVLLDDIGMQEFGLMMRLCF